MKILHLLSGGLDSTVMLYDLLNQKHEVRCLLFNYGQKHLTELRYAKATCRKLKVPFDEVELCRIKNLFLRCALTDGVSDNVVVPYRNGVFLSIATALAVSQMCDIVTFGATAEDYDQFPDCRPEFVDSVNNCLKSANASVSVSAPYIKTTKRDIVQIGRRLNVPFDETMSCYNGNNCGKCLACKLRKRALKCAR